MGLSGRLGIILFHVTLLYHSGCVLSQRQTEQEILPRILGGSYDKRVRPISRDFPGEPVLVRVNFYVRSIDAIDESKMEYSVQLSFREEWNDVRLNFSRYNNDLKYIVLSDVNQIWRPDTFFSNEKSSHLHSLMVPNNFVRIHANGDVMYSSRLSMTLNCTMDLRRYPFDKQTCPMRLASYGYTTSSVKLEWKDEQPVQVTEYLALPRFTMSDFKTDTCDSSTTTGSYSCLRLDFQFQRECHYHLIQIYIPCMMLVIISWLSFWLDRKAITARVILGISALLVMAMQVSSFNQRLPPVSYTKALDVWTGISLTFVFASLIELIVVNYIGRSEDEQKRDDPSPQQSPEEHGEEIPLNQITTGETEGTAPADATVSATQGVNSQVNRILSKYLYTITSKAERIDRVSRVAFPVAFLCFMLIYIIAYV